MLQRDKGLATIIGGSGFIGSQIVQELARLGYRVRVGCRRPDLAGHVRMLGGVGQVQPLQVNVRDHDSVAFAVSDADIVVNLVGILHEHGKQRFETIQSAGAGLVAAAAAEAGVQTLVHMSAIGADENSPSAYARSKAGGEAAVLKAFPKAIIMRPSLVFGPEDGLFNLFGMIARMSPVMPVIHGDTRFQPVYVGDVADAFAKAVDGEVKPGRVYELGGPDIETMKELMQRVLDEAQRNKPLLPIPAGLARFGAGFTQLLPNPLLTVDQVLQLGVDNVVSDKAIKDKRTLTGLKIAPTPMDEILHTYMWRFRKHGEFARAGA